MTLNATTRAEELLLVEAAEGIATVTLNRPGQFNALSSALIDTMQSTLDRIAADSHIRVVVLAARGRGFCSGHDLKEIRGMGNLAEVESLFARCSRMMVTFTAMPQPVIAKVHGLATAAGCQLVAQCDLAVASEEARFAVSGVNLGLFCSTPAVALSRNVSRKHAAEMLFTGDFIDAPQALEWGLVNRVVPHERLMEATHELANNLKSKPREVLALGKALFYRQLESGLGAAYSDASRTIAGNMATEVAREGVDAFLAKVPPRWKG
jgi:enoyl-CoA hydratase/carnithine racemase